MQETPEDLIKYLREIQTQFTDQEHIVAIEEKLNVYKSNPSNYQFALQLLMISPEDKVIWFATKILEHIIIIHWIPHSMNPDPSQAVLTEEVKAEIRGTLLELVTTKVMTLSETSRNFIFSLISKTMKIDFQNEGSFWLDKLTESLADHETCFPFLRIVRFLLEDIHTYDHITSTQTAIATKEAVYELVPGMCEAIVGILQNEAAPILTMIEVFKLISNLFLCTNEAFHQQIPAIIEILIAFSASSVQLELSIEAHRCLHTLFSRVNFIPLFEIEERQQILAASFEFFEQEMSQFVVGESSYEYLDTLLVAFQPLAEKYIFRPDMFEDEAVAEFLSNFEDWTWGLFGTDSFHTMIDMWIDFYHGASGISAQKFAGPFTSLIHHILEQMTDSEQIGNFSELDFEDINEMINSLMVSYPIDIYQLVQEATSISINQHLASVGFFLRLFMHMVTFLQDDDPRIEAIADNFLKYINELMTHCDAETVDETLELFILAKNIIQQYVRKFSRMSKHFLDKIFHLLLVSMQTTEQFVTPMLELLLETLKIFRPLETSRRVLEKLLEMNDQFLALSVDNYALYLCCFLIIAAFSPSDGGSMPLAANPELISEMYAVTFGNLSDPEHVAFSLKIMKMSVNSITLSQKVTKDLVYAAFAPHIETVLSIYEAGPTESVMKPLFEYLFAFISVFTTQVGDGMNEIIARLFAPLEASLPTIESGSIGHYAISSFLNLMLRIAQFRSSITEAQTENIVSFILGFGPAILVSSEEILTTSILIIKALLEDRWQGISPDVQMQLLHFLFFECFQNPYPQAMIHSMNTIMKCNERIHILEVVSDEFKYSAFSSACTEMCRSSTTILRDTIVEFATFLCGQAEGFVESLLHPFIRSLQIPEQDKVVLAELFSSYSNEDEFKKAFVSFCDDAAYLLMGTNP